MIRYGIDLDSIGELNLSSNISYVDNFDVQQTDGSIVDAAGNLNDYITNFPPIPQFRGNFTTTWILNDHNASATVRYVDSYENDKNGGCSCNA